MKMKIDEAKEIIIKFHKMFPGIKTVKYLVRNTLEDIGNNFVGIGLENAKGGYLDKDNIVMIAAKNHINKDDLVTTLKHEIFGHCALQGISKEEKNIFLSSINKLKYSQDVKPYFDKVNKHYTNYNRKEKSEEVFALISEEIPFGYKLCKRPKYNVETLKDIKNISHIFQNKYLKGTYKRNIDIQNNTKLKKFKPKIQSLSIER